MKKVRVLAAIAALAALGATTGDTLAAPATQVVTLTGTVAGYCTIDASNTGLGRSGDVTAQVSNGILTGAAVVLTGVNSPIVCNENVTIQLKSLNGGLLGPAATGPAINKINYTATAAANGKTDTLNTATGTAGAFDTGVSSTVGAVSGPLALTVITTTSGTAAAPLMAGAYSDTLTVQLTAVP